MDKNTFVLLYKAMVRPRLEYANSARCPSRKGILRERATKLIISLNKLLYLERLRQLELSTLKYRRLRGDMIEVFKIIHNYYDTGASVKLNFNPVGSTPGNIFKLRKEMCGYDIRKYSFCYRVVTFGTVCQLMW